MTAQEKVNQLFTTPAYRVQITYPVQSNRNKAFTFTDTNLLAARQAAFKKAQSIAAGKGIHDVLNLGIDLIQIDRTSTSDKHPVLAAAFQQRLNRTSFISDEGKDTLMNVDAFVAKSLPKSVFLTVGLERIQEPTNSLEVVANTLTDEEMAYYQLEGYSISF